MEKCCFCFKDLSDSSSKKKRKRLYGDSSADARKILEQFCADNDGSLEGFVETSDSRAFLCYLCDGELNRVMKLKEQLKFVSSCIAKKLQSLTQILSAGTTNSGCKRRCASSTLSDVEHHGAEGPSMKGLLWMKEGGKRHHQKSG